MKKAFITITALMLVLCLLTACTSTKDKVSKFQDENVIIENKEDDIISEDNNSVEDDTANSEVSDITPFQVELTVDANSPDIDERFLSVLKNETPFYLFEYGKKSKMYISNFVFPYSLNNFYSTDEIEYTVINLDNADYPELIVKGPFGDVLILHINSDEIIGYSFDFRSIDQIFSDGTFTWNDTNPLGLNYGISKLEFDEKGYKIIELCSVLSGDNEIYYVEGDVVEKESYDYYYQTLNTDKIPFYTINIITY